MYKNELDKARFAHDTVYSNSEDLSMKTVSDKFFKGRDYETALHLKCDGY